LFDVVISLAEIFLSYFTYFCTYHTPESPFASSYVVAIIREIFSNNFSHLL